jgi:hypothetical protein
VRQRAAIPLMLALVAALVWCASAQATFEPFALVSGNPALQLQADYAYDPAISANGQYVAFTGSVASKPGVYRKDLATGALEPVALGKDTGAPSISAEGRYVSFTTDEDPITDQTTSCLGVYVRDMDQLEEEIPPPSSAPPGTLPTDPAFTLASAANGSEESLAYATPAAGQPCGAAAAAKVALSGDGSKVAFTILNPSSLSGACTTTPASPPSPPATTCPTPPDQVVVRNIEAQTTTLVSVTRASLGGGPQAVPSGAALTGAPSSGNIGLPGGLTVDLPVSDSTAAISADGSTVAWMGVNIPEQVQVDSDPPTEGHLDGYAEPLWRRIAEGPSAPIRRVLAGDDPSAPHCPPECPGGLDLEWDTQAISAQEYTGAAPEFGSFTSKAALGGGFGADDGFYDTLDAVTPQLSESGQTVALLSTQPDYGQLPNFGVFPESTPPPANAFVVNMAPGLTRAEAITRLTEWGSLNFKEPGQAGEVTGIAISPDGNRVAFTTQRIVFPLAPPALITPPVSQDKAVQLYEANLQAGTLALVTLGYNGQPAEESVYGLALSGNGRTVALASGATNLAYGVVNEGSDVFSTTEIDSAPVAGEQFVTPLPPGPSLTPGWDISATSAPAPGGGALLLDVSVPGAGRLSASASAAVPVTVTVGRSQKHRSSRKHRAPRRSTAHARRASSARAHGAATVATREVAHASALTTEPRVIQLLLTPASRYRSLLNTKGGLYATIVVTFFAAGHPSLSQTLQVRFPRRHPLPIYPIPPAYRIPGYKVPKHHKHHPKQRRSHTTKGGKRK